MGRKILVCTVIIMFLCLNLVTPIFAEEPSYQNYTYSFEGIPFAEPQAYVPSEIITGIKLGIGAFKSPKDVFVANDNRVYIVDTGNNRIIVLDSQFKLLKAISQFEKNGKIEYFKNPNGIFVTQNNLMYIADTDNGRIIVLDNDNKFVAEYDSPKSKLVTGNFMYKPVKLVVDSSFRIFVVSLNVNKGIIELDKDGNFVSFYGAIPVVPDLGMIFWRMIATEEMKNRMSLELPTEYSSLDIDSKSFIYGAVSATGSNSGFNPDNLVKRLNPLGNDVLKRNGFFSPSGDINFEFDNGVAQTSKFADVCARPNGIYSTLDITKGRVFTYDETGNLLCVFGRYGEQLGDFGSPVALETLNNSDYLVVDAKYNQIVIYKPTDYIRLVLDAVSLQYNRKYIESEQKWSQVLKYTSKSDLAYDGMGRVLYRQGKNKEAMKYFQLASNRTLHSKSFDAYRTEQVGKYFTVIMIVLIVLGVLLFCLLPVIRKRKRRSNQK